MERIHKVWGERWLVRKDSTHATSYLKLQAGTRCSWHCHQAKYNLFVVLQGRVGIETEYGEIILTPGQEFTTKPGEWHEFRVYEDSEMIEEMYVEYDEGDIQRETVGGSFKIESENNVSKTWK
jgi:quercetin dioxygenase-like cupin family protein